MPRPTTSRVVGRAAVAALAAAAVTIPLGNGDAEAATEWSVSTDAPAGLIALGGGGYAANVPLDICAVEWTVIGGQGGAGSADAAGQRGGEVRVTTQRTAGQNFTLHPGGVGRDWAAGGAGGTNGVDAAGQPGTSGGGGGGAGSSLRYAGFDVVTAGGGDGGGATGGAGGERAGAGASGNGFAVLPGGGITSVTTFDGRTGDPGGTGRTGAGVISGVGLPCPATAPGAPRLIRSTTGPEQGVIYLGFEPAAPAAHQVWSPVTGWEVTLDGGLTWAALPTTPQPDGLLAATVRGLANGSYRVAVRATSAVGPSAPSYLVDIRIVGTPTGITVTDVSVAAGVSSLRVSWTPPEGEVLGGYLAESYDAAQNGENIPFSLCETGLDVHSCVLAAEPGRSYRVVVMAGGGRGAAPVTSGVVAAPPVPAQLPASSGALQVPAGSADTVTAGQAVDVSGSGYLPGSTVTVVVYSTPTVLDSLVTEGDGSFDTSVTLPAGLPAGAHTLVATGVDRNGDTWTLTRSVTAGGVQAGADGGPVVDLVAAPAPGDPAGPAAAGLASTGVDVAVPAIGGLLALTLGAVLICLGHRRRAARQH